MNSVVVVVVISSDQWWWWFCESGKVVTVFKVAHVRRLSSVGTDVFHHFDPKRWLYTAVRVVYGIFSSLGAISPLIFA